MDTFLGLIGRLAIVIAIVTVTRWLFGTKGAKTPETRSGVSVYRVNGAWRAVGVVSTIFCSVLAFRSIRDFPDVSTVISLSFFMLLAAGGVWLASGLVIIDQSGITKKVLWHSSCIPWKDITELRRFNKRGDAIEVRASSRRFVIDSRFIAFEHLWLRLLNETSLQQVSEKCYVRRQPGNRSSKESNGTY